MKNMKKRFFIIAVFGALVLAACNDFLDENPDMRAELTTPTKIAQILVSAYPTELPTLMFDYMSDNVEDNGPDVSSLFNQPYQAYHYMDMTDPDWDVPTRIWQICYSSIASANMALDAIEKLNDPDATNGIKAEALLCRAFGHFMLVNTFCMPWNPVSSETDMGIPYVEAPETTVAPEYERGTVAGVYENIDRDIEEALPLLSDEHLTQPKYHFNTRAAYAFATRFNLYYGKWKKVVEYATKAIGENPTQLLRDWNRFDELAVNPNDWMYSYINKEDPANLLLLPQRSIYGRVTGNFNRYAFTSAKAQLIVWQYFPWESGYLDGFTKAWGDERTIYLPKVGEIFEFTDPVARIGYPHVVLTMFTADETLACRAEAHVMLGEYDAAANDLNYWYLKNGDGTTYTVEQISNYYSKGSSRFERVDIDSRFGVEPGTQENLLHAVLTLRRFEGVFEGTRFPDIKRHGITVKHVIQITNNQADTLVIRPYDLRTAIQLPVDVIYAGLPANPR